MVASKFRAAALASVGTLLLSGCLLSPGQFDSELALMKDGRFTYSYDGEIQMLALSQLAQMGGDAEDEFAAQCRDDAFEERECTAAEVAEQKSEWDADAEERRAERDRKAKQMGALVGGIDPSDPKAAEELVRILQRQRGWNAVEYLGNGLFDVDFAIAGRLTHDFTFPTIEKLPINTSFVTVILRDDNQIRVDAPAFVGEGDSASALGGFPLAAVAAMSKGDSPDKMPEVVTPNGRFSIVTDGTILANNTDEGPQPHVGGQILTWEIGPRSEQAPTALIDLD